MIVGLKTDLRNDEDVIKELNAINLSPVSTEEGIALAKKVGAYAYVECSAKAQDGMKKVFEEVASCLLTEKKIHKKRQCVLQ